MKTILIPLTSLLFSSVALAAAPKAVVWSEDPALPGILEEGGIQKLTPERLSEAEVLVIHGPGGQKRLDAARSEVEAFVKRGGGLVVLGNGIESAASLKPWVGGAWTPQSRKFSGLTMFYPFTEGHPITRDAYAFDVTDDTVYDLDLDPGIQVIGSAFTPKVTRKKVDNRAPEKLDRANVYDIQPQMWTYQSPSGNRAFVLLQGGSTTLRHDSMRTFVLRGIAWASKRENFDDLRGLPSRERLHYPEGGARTAEETVKSFDLTPGFEARVVASEPLIHKPIAMQFDARGRLWVAETPEYPNGRRPLKAEPWKETSALNPGNYERPATDQISILSDPDAQGKFTRKTVFHEGLELVTGFCLYKEGVIAIHQPDIVYIHGEGKAQRVERLFTGFTPGDTHFVVNHLVLAADGWVYANSGGSLGAVGVAFPEVKAKLSSGVFRFRPDGSAIEQVGSKGGNGFGLDVSSEGEIFSGQATSGSPLQHLALPEWVLGKAKVGGAGSLESTMLGRKVVRNDMPTRVPYMQIDVVGGYSAACASTLYEAGAWPAEWNRTLFCTEPILDVIHAETLKAGSTKFSSEMQNPEREFLRAKDFWFFPVDVQFGPDGAMYLLDFYNPIVAHSDTRGPAHGLAKASIRPDREHYYGRIYRVQHREAKHLEIPDLTRLDAAGLVTAFAHPNKATRLHAQRLLLERADAAQFLPQLQETARHSASVPARILALWTLQRMGRLDTALLQAAIQAEDPDLRKAALLVVEAQGRSATVPLEAAVKDSDPRVRLMALRALSARPLSPEASVALLEVLPSLKDNWSLSAATAAAASNPVETLVTALSSKIVPVPELHAMAKELARIVSEQNGESMARVLAAIARVTPEASPLVPEILEVAGRRIATQPPVGKEWMGTLERLVASEDPVVAAGALPFLAKWDQAGSASQTLQGTVDRLLGESRNAKRKEKERIAVIEGLVRAQARDVRILPAMLALLGEKGSEPLQLALISALAENGDAAIGKALVQVMAGLSEGPQEALFEALTARSSWAQQLLDGLSAGDLDKSLLKPARLSRLKFHPEAAVARRAVQLFAQLGVSSSAAKEEVIAKMLSAVESKTGSAARGKSTFGTVCASCHRFNGEGHEVGPVLDGMGVHGTHELLVHILDPSRVVDNEHRTWSVGLKNGSFAVGIIASENDRGLTLRLPGGVSTDIRAADVKSRKDTGLSLMPEGFEALGAEALADILAYLREGSGKFRSLNLTAAFTTDTRAGLYASREKVSETLQPTKYGVVQVEGVPFVLPDPATTPSGGNVIVLKADGSGAYASSLPQSVVVPVGFAAANLRFLGGVAGVVSGGKSGRPAMRVTLEYADGKKQQEDFAFGEVFAEASSAEEVPRSTRVNGLVKQNHVRTFTLPVRERSVIKQVVLESLLNGLAPTTFAITAETDVSTGKEAPAQGSHAGAPNNPPAFLPPSGETLPEKAEAGVLRVLLVGGGSSHDFERFFRQADGATLRESGCCVTAYTANAPEAVALMPRADVLVLSANHPSFGKREFQDALQAFADAGKGVVVVHAGTWYNWRTASDYQRRFVGGGAKGHGKGVFQVIAKVPEHPVMEGVPAEFAILDEHYRVELDPGVAVRVLAMTSVETATQKAFPSVWVVEDAKARIVCTGLGHGAEAHENAAYRRLLQNAVRWVGAGR
ncbi:MAG: hypothetical protein RLZZ399_691 [Verrucomicrobiota bacterium]|jgi:putative membrane-bound dehydrogenase-like protein